MTDSMTNLTKKWLQARGWHTWYNENYWVNPKTVANPQAQDYTNYGMSIEEAVSYERKGRKPFSPTPLAGLMRSGAAQNNFNRGSNG